MASAKKDDKLVPSTAMTNREQEMSPQNNHEQDHAESLNSDEMAHAETIIRKAIGKTFVQSDDFPLSNLDFSKTYGKQPFTRTFEDSTPVEELEKFKQQIPSIHLDSMHGRVADNNTSTNANSNRDFVILGDLGQGGMGTVHLAYQTSIPREVAIKIPYDEEQSLALINEARLGGQLEHPSIVPVHALGFNQDGKPILVMKKISGVSWHELIYNVGHSFWNVLLPNSADAHNPDRQLQYHLEVVLKICDVLEFAHQKGVIHRDIKPANVMLGSFGETYLLDWGVATRPNKNQTNEFRGSPAYMAPEMAKGDPIDARTDIYLLGSTLHEVLTKSTRHYGTNIHQTIRSCLQSAKVYYDKRVPTELAILTNKATNVDPIERPQSIREFRIELLDYINHRSSRRLAQEGYAKLQELKTLLQTEDNQPTVNSRLGMMVEQVATECRFAFIQALTSWPENIQATDGLDKCLHLVAEDALTRDDIRTARAAYQQLQRPSPSLKEKIAETSAKLKAKISETQELRDMAYDLNWYVSATKRLSVFLFMAGIVGVLTIYGLWVDKESAGAVSPYSLVGFSCTTLGILVFTVLIFKNSLLTTLVNWRIFITFCLSLVAVIFHRLIAVKYSVPHEQIYPIDLLIMTLTTSIASTTIHLSFWIMAAIFGLGAGLCLLFENHAPYVFSISIISSILIMTSSNLIQQAQKSNETASIQDPDMPEQS